MAYRKGIYDLALVLAHHDDRIIQLIFPKHQLTKKPSLNYLRLAHKMSEEHIRGLGLVFKNKRRK